MNKQFFFLFITISFSLHSFAQFRVANVLSSNMVIQRDLPVKISGVGAPGQTVRVTFAQATKSVVIKTDSTWQLVFKKQKANPVAQSISVSCGSENVMLTNILIGDVWLCAGQSNMEWPMSKELHWQQEMNRANQPLIRINNPRFSIGDIRRISNSNNFYQWSAWDTCSSVTIENMSAVGYYFAKEIVTNENVPIGLINIAIGGAPIETFISRHAMQDSKQFSGKVLGNWVDNSSLPIWARIRGKDVSANQKLSKDSSGPDHLFKPGFAYDAGVKPLISFPIKGVLWYQGETNAMEIERVKEYGDLFKLMVTDYRKQWHQPDLPFYWVQLSSIDTAYYQSKYWPEFRDEQRKLLQQIPNGGMAVSSDVGVYNNVHPPNKKDVGVRLARWALYKTYRRSVIPSGPLSLSAKYVAGEVVVTFRFAKGLMSKDGEQVHGFSLDGVSEVDAMIKNGKIIILANAKPGVVYYSWKAFADGNLINEERLPASTFKITVQ